MRPAFHFLLSALVLPVAAGSALADQGTAAIARVSSFAARNPAPDTVMLQRLLAQADEASVTGRSAKARQLYRTLVQEQRAANVYAGTALWRLAGIQLFDGKLTDAALTLDQTAQEAARFGDPAMELRATFEAAILWQKARRNDLAMSNLERVRCLLQSPVIDGELKSSIEQRIVG
ncbi:MAG: hypothetical protein AMXMBFR55_21540 [Gemmatimonadota bacterium]